MTASAKCRLRSLPQTVLSLAVTRPIEIVGEAAAHVTVETQRAIDLPWREVIATRNRYIHGYGDVDCRIVWAIVTRDLPGLVQRLASGLS